MRVEQFVNNLPTLQFSLYSELTKVEAPVKWCHDYRFLWTESGTIDDGMMDVIICELELLGIPRWILSALTYDELHNALINYTLIVHEQVVHVLSQQKPISDEGLSTLEE